MEPMMVHQEGPAVTQSHDREQSWPEGWREDIRLFEKAENEKVTCAVV